MQLFKFSTLIISGIILGFAAWLYFTRDTSCADQPWWLVLLIGVLNLALSMYILFGLKNEKAKESSAK